MVYGSWFMGVFAGAWFMVITLISKYGCLPGGKREKIKKIHTRKLGKSFRITNCKTFFQFLYVNIYKE
jgi:hypothetical protein